MASAPGVAQDRIDHLGDRRAGEDAVMCSHIPNRGEQMVCYPGFGITIGGYSSSE
jgi:hypothetical protein